VSEKRIQFGLINLKGCQNGRFVDEGKSMLINLGILRNYCKKPKWGILYLEVRFLIKHFLMATD
jgi:hypothetical protein